MKMYLLTSDKARVERLKLEEKCFPVEHAARDLVRGANPCMYEGFR